MTVKEYAEKLYPKTERIKGMKLVSVSNSHKKQGFLNGLKIMWGFAEWCFDNDWRYLGDSNWRKCIEYKKRPDGNVYNYATTPELTELFLNDKMKEK